MGCGVLIRGEYVKWVQSGCVAGQRCAEDGGVVCSGAWAMAL